MLIIIDETLVSLAGVVSGGAVAMSSPTVLLNNLVQEEDSSYIDPISKGFIVTEAAIGFNRLAVFGKIKPIYVILASMYTLFICGAILFMIYYRDHNGLYAVVIVMDGMAYIICVTISTLMWKRLQLYFNELQKFDRAVGCRPKTTASSIKNVIQMVLEIILMLQSLPYEWYVADTISMHQLVERMIYITEVHFCGHLLSLLVPRLRLINYYMKMSLSDNKQVSSPKVEKLPYFKANNLETQNCQIKKLMELYCIIINAYDLLIEAIKWQVSSPLPILYFLTRSNFIQYLTSLHPCLHSYHIYVNIKSTGIKQYSLICSVYVHRNCTNYFFLGV